MQMKVVEAILEPHLQRAFRVGGDEPSLSQIMQVEVLNDDTRFRDGAGAILQHRELTAGPQRLERRRVRRVHQIDDVLLKRRVVLIKRDQRLVAERRKRMEMKGESHAFALGLGERRDRYAWTISLKPPKIIRLGSNGRVPLCIILSMRGSFITLAITLSRCARDL